MYREAKNMRLSQPQQIMASEPNNDRMKPMRGDIIGVFDPGIFSIGDTLCMRQGSSLHTKESLPSRRSILQGCVRWIP